MFRKPPTKLEQLQDTLSHTLESLHDTLENLPLDRLKDARDSVGESVAHGFGTARHKAGDAFHVAAGALGSAAEAAREAAIAARESAASAAGTTAHAASELASRAGDTASHAASAVVAKASHAASRAGEVAGGARENAAHAASAVVAAPGHIAHAAIKKVRRGTDETQNQAMQFAETARQKAGEIRLPHLRRTEVEIDESSSRWLWIAVGVLAGAALILFLAPTVGRRNRALAKDKLKDAKAKATGVARRAAGAIQERISGEEDDADDITIADRVRTALGEAPATRNLERLNVDCADGLVTLRGPMADAELVGQIEAVVRAVKGVKDVRSEMLLEESADDSPTFVG